MTTQPPPTQQRAGVATNMNRTHRFEIAALLSLLVFAEGHADAEELTDAQKKVAAQESGHYYKQDNLEYTGGKARPKSKEAPQFFCGYLEYQLTSRPLGGGKWSPAQSAGEPAEQPTELPKCTFPAGAKAFGAATTQARSSFPGWVKSDKLVVMPGEAWAVEKSADDKVVSRSVTARYYSKKWERKAAYCGSFDKNTYCGGEGEKGAARKMGSLVDSYNHGVFALAKARKAKEQSDFKECRVKAFRAVMDLGGYPEYKQEHADKKEWVTGGRFLTDGGLPYLTEQQLFDRAAKGATEGRALFDACGGTNLDKKLNQD